jgi:hypothetical protein
LFSEDVIRREEREWEGIFKGKKKHLLGKSGGQLRRRGPP